ncbi:MAG TPA: glycosyltransferase family 2 protein [Blastocatellia bacterium]
MISVIMPAYNASDYISEAIESIRRQTYRDLELIIVDDGSTDDTAKIASAHEAKDNRIRVLRSNHGGNCAARNIGVREARYPWIAAMDADDVARPERLEKQLAAVTANPRIVALGTAVYHLIGSRVVGVARHGPESEAEFYRRRQTGEDISLYHPSALMNKEVFLKVGGYDDVFQDCSEFELFDRMAAFGPILALPEPLVYYRLHSGSMSMQRFFDQRLSSRYVTARNKARISGEPPMSFDEFVLACRRQPLRERLRIWAIDMCNYHYRAAGLSYGEGKYAAALFHLGLSTFLRPDYVLPRLWKQRLSPQSRQELRTGQASI